jgi:photosystem II stability/assembly factor-like uncharacterized protein
MLSLKENSMKAALLLTGLITLCGFLNQVNANPVLIPGTWVNVTPPGIPLNDPYSMLGQGITVDPNNPSTIWWCNGTYQPSTKGGLYKSTDGGSTWTKIAPFDVPLHVRIDPKNSNHVYVIDGVRGNYMGFWVSTDGGANWTQPQGFKTAAGDTTVNTFDGYSVAVDPSDFNHCLVSFHSGWPDRAGYSYSCGVFESKDGGNSWTIHYPVAGMTGPGFGVDFLYSPDLKVGDKNTWLLGCQGGGFWRTSDAGTTWKKVSDYNMVHGGNQIYYTKSGVLYSGSAGYPGSPLRSTDNGLTWQSGSGNFSTLGIMGDGNTLYAGTFNQSGPFMTSPESDGLKWTLFNNSSQRFLSGPFELDFDKVNHIMYASTPGDGVWALCVNDPNTGIFLSDATANPQQVFDNSTTTVTFSINATAQGNITGVFLNLKQIGGDSLVVMTNSSGSLYTTSYTIKSGLIAGDKALLVTAKDNAGHTLYGSITLSVLFHDAPVLVSKNKPVTVSSVQDSSMAGKYAVDNKPGTRWASAASDPQWIYVDLGENLPVIQVILRWEAAYAKAYKIQVSNDASTWTDVYSTTNGSGGTETVNFAQVNTRYVRMYGTQRATDYGYSLFEFEVYAAAGTSVITESKPVHSNVKLHGSRLLVMSTGAHINRWKKGVVYNVQGRKIDGIRIANQAVVQKIK